MALAIDGSSPAVATQTSAFTTTVTTASFTPPSGSLLLISWSWNSQASTDPSSPTITDNLGTHLTYTLIDWSHRADTPAADGQAAQWWAVVSSSAAMTITVTGGVASADNGGAIKVTVLTGADTVTPIGAHGKSGSTSASSIAQSYTATASNGWGFLADLDWDVKGAQTAGTGCTSDGSANVGTLVTYGFHRRTTADDVSGNSNTLNVTLPGTSTNLRWAYAEVLPLAAASVPYNPQRTVQGRDPGEAWWLQRDTRDANTVGSAVNVLPSPLDTVSRYPHLYGDWTRPAAWPQQRAVYDQSPFVAVAATIPPAVTRTVVVRDPGETWWQQRPGRDPAMLGQPQLENELLGGADTAKRYAEPARHAPRWWMPQQPPRVATTPGLLDTALLESPLLGAADDLRRHAAAADYCDRRLVPQQRPYVSDPNLLATAELENELLGGATTALRYVLPATHADRREMPQQRLYVSDPSFYPTVAPTDPLTVAWGAGGPLWWLYNTAAAQVDRREVPQQRRYVSDPALLLSALLENELLGSADDLRRRTFAAATWLRPTPPAIRMPSTLGAPDADPLILTGDIMRRVSVAAYVDRREVPAQPPRWTLYFDAGPGLPPLTLAWGAGGAYWHLYNRAARRDPWAWWPQRVSAMALAHSCTTPRPSLGITARPSSGLTSRPNSGTTSRPCVG